MKNKHLALAFLLAISSSLNVFAINAPLVEAIPSSVDANTYNITVYVKEGATVSVVGGPSQLAPVTDGAGQDPEDGEVEVEVALAQNQVNSFSITAQMGTDISDSVIIEINEVSDAKAEDAPKAPLLNEIPGFVDSIEYIITGFTEANANVYARTVEGDAVSSTKADGEGFFQVMVPLEESKTNRFNVSAENEKAGEGRATQAVIRQSVDLEGEAEEEEKKLDTSAQIFFNDIKGHWAESYINHLYAQEVVSGKSEGIFEPNGLITRAELTKVAILAFGHSVNTSVDEHPFQDVPRNSWFAPFVEEAQRLGFVDGYTSGGFGPNNFITRAAALKIILGAAGIDVSGMKADFPDVAQDAWFIEYVGYAQKNNIVGGYEDGSFGPAHNITRAQVAKIVIKVLELKNKPTI